MDQKKKKEIKRWVNKICSSFSPNLLSQERATSFLKGIYILVKSFGHLMYICFLITQMFLELNEEQFSESKDLTFENLDGNFILFMIISMITNIWLYHSKLTFIVLDTLILLHVFWLLLLLTSEFLLLGLYQCK